MRAGKVVLLLAVLATMGTGAGGGARAAPMLDEPAAGCAVMQALPEALRTEASISPRPRGVEAGAGRLWSE